MALFGKKKKVGSDATDTTVAPEPTPAKTSEPVIVPPKPKASADVYTLLLGLSVTALVVATVLLFLNINNYGPNPLSGIPK